jgi:hypothetical protein
MSPIEFSGPPRKVRRPTRSRLSDEGRAIESTCGRRIVRAIRVDERGGVLGVEGCWPSAFCVRSGEESVEHAVFAQRTVRAQLDGRWAVLRHAAQAADRC